MRKQTVLHQLSHKVFSWFGWKLVCCWDLFVWWTSYSFYLVWSVFKGENPTCVISTTTRKGKKSALACILTFNDQFLSILFVWERSVNSRFWYQFVWPWPSFKVTVVWENNFCAHFLTNFCIDMDKIQCAAATCWLLKCMQCLFSRFMFKGENFTYAIYSIHILVILAYVLALVNWFISNLVWLKYTEWFHFEWPWPSVRVTGLWDN